MPQCAQPSFFVLLLFSVVKFFINFLHPLQVIPHTSTLITKFVLPTMSPHTIVPTAENSRACVKETFPFAPSFYHCLPSPYLILSQLKVTAPPWDHPKLVLQFFNRTLLTISHSKVPYCSCSCNPQPGHMKSNNQQ